MNRSGKVLTIFIVLIAILLVSLTAISLFFFQQELQKRKSTEGMLELTRARVTKLETELEEAKKQKYLLEEKNKELDERVNNLLDELELEQGLKEEMKREQLALTERIEKETRSKEKLKEDLTQQIKEADVRIKELEEKLRKEIEISYKLKESNRLLEKENLELARGMNLSDYVPVTQRSEETKADEMAKTETEMSLDEIVVTTDTEGDVYVVPAEIPDGRIISVDEETEFVIIDLGKKHGVTLGRVMSVYRGDKYLGDIKVSRVQPEMSAADLILPLTGKVVRKNDQVIAK